MIRVSQIPVWVAFSSKKEAGWCKGKAPRRRKEKTARAWKEGSSSCPYYWGSQGKIRLRREILNEGCKETFGCSRGTACRGQYDQAINNCGAVEKANWWGLRGFSAMIWRWRERKYTYYLIQSFCLGKCKLVYPELFSSTAAIHT